MNEEKMNFEQALAELNISPQTEEIPYDDLLEQAYIDKMTERGTFR